MNLISQWYTPSSEVRGDEMRMCKAKNESSDLFDEIVYLDGDAKRSTFKDLFDECVKRWSGQLCVVANSDIWFDDSLRLLGGISSDRSFVTLTRWDSPSSPAMHGHVVFVKEGEGGLPEGVFFSGTQDSWCFIAGDVHLSAPEVPLGVQGGDQAIVAWACEKKLFVADPAISIRSWHEHKDKNGNQSHSVVSMYAYPELTTTDSRGLVAFHDLPEGASGVFDVADRIQVMRCLR